jgi:long-chain acyl-CoA synthetase
MNFIDALWASLDRGSIAVVEQHASGPQTTAARELREKAESCQAALAELGVVPGDRVALLAPNSAAWIAADLALLRIGAISVPLYVRQAVTELAAMGRDAGAKLVLVADPALGDRLLAAWPEARIVALDSLRAAPGAAVPHPRPADAPVTLIYTSGTSGEAKGVITTRGNVDAMLPATTEALGELLAAVDGEERVFHYLPLCFSGSRITLWTALLRRAVVHLSMDLDRVVDEIGAARPHYFLNVPVLLERIRNRAEAAFRGKGMAIAAVYDRARAAHAGSTSLLDRAALAIARRLLFPAVAARLGPDLRFLICGSAPLTAETQSFFALLGVQVYQVYGLTETTAIVTMDRAGDNRPGRVGHAISAVEVRLGPEDELWVRGPAITPGYWGRAEATAAAFTDGWFRTGDQVAQDATGSLAIIGRVKNLLAPTSGHNVPPEPIEEALQAAIPGAEQVVVIGHGRPHLVALLFGSVTHAQAGIDAVNADLPFYKRVRGFYVRSALLTTEDGLLTANGKLKRPAIEAAFRAEIAAMYDQKGDP